MKLTQNAYCIINFTKQTFDITNDDVTLDTIIGEFEPKENSSTFGVG
jgi:hypothetical protein